MKAVSNRATWSEAVEIFDDTTDAPLDISAATEIKLQVHEDDPFCRSPRLSASLTGGTITIENQTGVFTFEFSASQMNGLCPRTYKVGAIAVVAGKTIQLLIGNLPIVEGYVT